MKVNEKYVFFQGGEFSNWTSAPFCDSEKGIVFNSSEQYVMYCKAVLFGDMDMAYQILMKGKNPKTAKMMGRKVKNFDSEKWDEVKFEIMKEANRLKYSYNPDLKKKLMSYGDRAFVETSPMDKIWGIGLGENDPRIEDEEQWRGQNLLGKVLTELAKEFREEEE